MEFLWANLCSLDLVLLWNLVSPKPYQGFLPSTSNVEEEANIPSLFPSQSFEKDSAIQNKPWERKVKSTWRWVFYRQLTMGNLTRCFVSTTLILGRNNKEKGERVERRGEIERDGRLIEIGINLSLLFQVIITRRLKRDRLSMWVLVGRDAAKGVLKSSEEIFLDWHLLICFEILVFLFFSRELELLRLWNSIG